jgi:hypothetical protein
MKEKVIEAAGKTWRFLGQNGQTSVTQLAKSLKEKDELVLQALGWLAREDKIDYTVKNRRTFVSLVERELRAFNTVIYNMNEQITTQEVIGSKGKLKTKTRK